MSQRLLYVGDLWYGSTALWRMRALEQIGLLIDPIDSTRHWTGWRSRLQNLAQKLKFGLDPQDINGKLIQRVLATEYEAVWIDKGLWTRPGTLREIKRIKPHVTLIAYSPDDMFNPINQTRRYLKSLPLYDHVVTTKKHNMAEYQAAGVQRVHYVQKSYDPHEQRMHELTAADHKQFGCDVGFIGNFEQPRFASMLRLAHEGIPVSIRGAAWKGHAHAHEKLQVDAQNYFGVAYAKILQATKINLGFLHKGNRDQHTARSIEIPACGGFLLAERTREHQDLFEEDKEAVFFDSDDELVDKVKYYLVHERDRKAIALAGYERCIKSQYDNFHVFKRLIDQILP